MFSLCILVMFLRRPDTLLYANFWAEDGRIWYSQLYNYGTESFLMPANGYFQTVSRLAMFITLPFGIINAPFISNLLSFIIRVCPIMFLFSKRFPFVPLPCKFIMTIYYLVMPNVDEVWGNITNVHWYLAIWLLMVILAEKSDDIFHKIHDFFVLFLSGFSGPFIVFFLPCLLLKKFYEDNIKFRFKFSAFQIAAAIIFSVQCASIAVTATEGRSHMELGASLTLLSQIISVKIIAGSFFPVHIIYDFFLRHEIVSIVLATFFSISLLYFFFSSSWRFKVAMIFPLLMITAGLISPVVSDTEAQWPILLQPFLCERYFVITNVMFFAYLLYIINIFTKGFSTIATPYIVAALTWLLIITDGLSFNITPLPDHDYKSNVRNIYYTAKKGDKVVLPINPQGWSVEIIKK